MQSHVGAWQISIVPYIEPWIHQHTSWFGGWPSVCLGIAMTIQSFVLSNDSFYDLWFWQAKKQRQSRWRGAGVQYFGTYGLHNADLWYIQLKYPSRLVHHMSTLTKHEAKELIAYGFLWNDFQPDQPLETFGAIETTFDGQWYEWWSSELIKS